MLKSITHYIAMIRGGFVTLAPASNNCFNELFNIANLTTNLQPQRGSIGSPFEYRLLAISSYSLRFFLHF